MHAHKKLEVNEAYGCQDMRHNKKLCLMLIFAKVGHSDLVLWDTT